MVRLLAHHGPEALVPFLLGAGTLTWHWARLRLSSRRHERATSSGDTGARGHAPVTAVMTSRRSSP